MGNRIAAGTFWGRELIFMPTGAAVSMLKQTCSMVYVDKSVRDFAHHADLV